jgi:hypothetical protein
MSSASMQARKGGGDALPSAVLELTLRGVHQLRLTRDSTGLTLAVENLDTGDKFRRNVGVEDMAALVPDKLKADMESLDDFEVRGTCGCVLSAVAGAFASTGAARKRGAAMNRRRARHVGGYRRCPDARIRWQAPR